MMSVNVELDPVFKLDKTAAVRGGAKAGQYLQGIGTTDLASLTVPQFEHFCHLLVAEAWRASLDDYIAAVDRAPPF